MVASVLQRAGEAAHAVDDLAESLAIFDLKLRHMREVRARASGDLSESQSMLALCSTPGSVHSHSLWMPLPVTGQLASAGCAYHVFSKMRPGCPEECNDWEDHAVWLCALLCARTSCCVVCMLE